MKKICILFIMFLFAGCALQEISITGVVKNTVGVGIGGVKINSGSIEKESGNDGSFAISGEVAGTGSIVLYFSGPGLKDEEKEVIIIEQGESSDLAPETPYVEVTMESN